jgi:hypothetical protein
MSIRSFARRVGGCRCVGRPRLGLSGSLISLGDLCPKGDFLIGPGLFKYGSSRFSIGRDNSGDPRLNPPLPVTVHSNGNKRTNQRAENRRPPQRSTEFL